MPKISELVRGAIDAGTSAHELARRSRDVVAHQQFTKLANGEVKGWPKSARAVEGIARALDIDPRAVVLGFAADLGVEVRDSRSALAARLPAEAADLSLDQASTIAQLIRWIAASAPAADVPPPRLRRVGPRPAPIEHPEDVVEEAAYHSPEPAGLSEPESP